MPNPHAIPLVAVAALLAAQPALAQTDSDQAEVPPDKGEIVVTARLIPGAIDTAQPPVATYSENDIASLGASSFADVLARLGPQVGSGRGRGGGFPIVLVNGQRIANFREMRNFPPEAIRRVDVLPEEVALRFGFPPDQRVVNFILKDNFASKNAEIEYGQPDRGGTGTAKAEATLLRISGPNRVSVTGSADRTSALTEAERGLTASPGAAATVASDPDPARYRTLIGAAQDYSLNAVWTRGLGKDGLGGQLTLSGTATRTDNQALSGLDSAVLVAPGGASALRYLPGPLERRSQVTNLQAGAGLNTLLGDWQLSATLDAGHSVTLGRFDARADTAALVAAAAAGTLAIDGPLPALPGAGIDTTRLASDSAASLVTLIGKPLHLPAGPLLATIKAGYGYSAINSADSRSSLGPAQLRRGTLSSGINLGLPLTSRRGNVLPALGDLTLNLSGGIDHLSDFGSVTDWSTGLTWKPREPLTLQASYIVNQAAPGLSDLGSPLTTTFNVPVYDFTRGETVLATVTGGGNPALSRETQRDLKLSATWQLPFLSNSNLLVEYFRNRSNNVSAAFPLLTPAIEAAFPGRVTRDATGRIVALDARSVTLFSQRGERLRWGFNLGGPLGKPASGGGRFGAAMGGPRPGGFPGGRPGAARGGGAMAAMLGGGQGRWNFGLFHTVQFVSRVTVAQGGPVLDLLGGDALSGGGTARHALEFNGGAFHKGLGLFLQGSWAAPTRVRASGVPGSSDLRFGSVTRLDLNLFANLAQLAPRQDWLKGARVALRIQNLFDSRQKVTDASGAVPFSYLPDRIDPQGRVIGIEMRKMF